MKLDFAALAVRFVLALSVVVALAPGATAQTPAKQLFGKKRLPAVLEPAAYGFYSKGCVSGAVAIPHDGPTWQAMRPHRNRRWGHPDTIKLVIQLSQDAKKVGWNGLLVGDISQPRGGPMLTGHASHQVGLDADIWLTEMPNRRFTVKERNSVSATSMLKRRNGKLDQTDISRDHFTKEHFGLIKTAASYKAVQRVLVHPTIKRELCRMEKSTNRSWLHKVRPYWGHHYHMHVRLACPAGSPNCRPQAAPKADDGCGEEINYWFKLLNPPKRKKTTAKKSPVKKKKKKVVKRKPKPQIRLSDLPQACAVVLNASAPINAAGAEVRLANGRPVAPVLKPAPPGSVSLDVSRIATPVFRPQL